MKFTSSINQPLCDQSLYDMYFVLFLSTRNKRSPYLDIQCISIHTKLYAMYSLSRPEHVTGPVREGLTWTDRTRPSCASLSIWQIIIQKFFWHWKWYLTNPKSLWKIYNQICINLLYCTLYTWPEVMFSIESNILLIIMYVLIMKGRLQFRKQIQRFIVFDM